MSKFTRRDLIHASCTTAVVSLVPHFMDVAEAGMNHGIAAVVTPSGLSQRNVINLNAVNGTTDYAFIDHTKGGANGLWSPVSSAFTGANPTFSSTLDANGWPVLSSANGQAFGGGINVPDPTNFPGPYVIDFVGNGKLSLNIQFPNGAVGTFTPGTGSNGMPAPVNGSVTFNSGGTFQFTSTGGASTASFQFTFTSTLAGPQGFLLQCVGTGTSGFFVKSVRFYRAADATDLSNGLIFRRGWKQPLVDLCPSAIRCMDWIGGVSSLNNRWENRTLPSNAGYTYGENWIASPNYQTDVTGNNQMVVAAATPTTGNPQTTPTNMVHGEICTHRIPSAGGTQRITNNLTVTSITNANPGVVTTSSAHPYITGDIVGHYFGPIAGVGASLHSTNQMTNVASLNVVNGMFVYGPGIPANTTVLSGGGTSTLTLSNNATITSGVGAFSFSSMQNLHLFPCTIAVIDSTHYSLGIDTTSMGAFSTNSASPVFTYQFMTLQVGTGGSGSFPRTGPPGSPTTGYPCTGTSPGLPFTVFGSTRSVNNYYTAWFDKTISMQTDGSGNPVMGVWMLSGNPGAHQGDVPVEVCVALINELNAMSPAHTIGMWLNIPTWGLSSMDPDYTTASDWAVNCLDTVLNPSSTVRASGFSALGYSGATKLNSPVLIVEDGNEMWNGSAPQKGYLVQRGIQRWPTAVPYTDFQDMQALRSTCMVTDIKAALSPTLLANTKFVLGMFGTAGMGNNQFNTNYAVSFAGSVTANPILNGDWYTNDTLTLSKGWGTPISIHDGVAPASYFDPVTGYYQTFGAGSFADDSAMYNGVDNSGTLSFTGGTGGVASKTLITTAFAAGSPVLNQPIVGSGITNPTTIVGISGTTPNFTLTLSQNATVANGTTITSPSPSISWQGTVSGTTLTLTGASTHTINSYQAFTGPGVTSGTFVVSKLSGTNGAIGSTYKLNNSFTISSPVTMSNVGGNYIGSANQSQALTNFVNTVVDAPNNFNTESPTRYATVLYPQYATQIGLTKFVLGYEGGANWGTGIGSTTNGGTIVDTGNSAFYIATLGSSQWGTAQVNFFNTVCAISNVFMPAIFLWIQGNDGPFPTVNNSNQRWAYCFPDSYATISGTPTEGAALTVNSNTFIAMSARNVALPN